MHSDKSDLSTDNVEHATVIRGQWIVYEAKDYAPQGGKVKTRVLTTDDGRVDFTIGSIRQNKGFETESVVLYEHPNYCGTQEILEDSKAKLKTPGKPFYGTSSIIVNGGKWKFYKEENYVGFGHELGQGLYPDHIPYSDQIKSVEYMKEE